MLKLRNMDTKTKISTFFASFSPFSYKTGDRVINSTDEINDIYFLETGKVRMYAISADGSEVTLNMFGAGSYFPIMIPLSGKPNSYYFDVLEPITGYKAPTEKVISFLKNEPELLFELTTNFSRGLVGLTSRIETLAFDNAYERVRNVLGYLAGKQESSNDHVVLTLTHEDIAAWIGLQRETVSRQIEKMQKQGLLEIKNKEIIIHRLELFKQG